MFTFLISILCSYIFTLHQCKRSYLFNKLSILTEERLQGILGDTCYKLNFSDISVPASLSGGNHWPISKHSVYKSMLLTSLRFVSRNLTASCQVKMSPKLQGLCKLGELTL